MGFRPAQSFHAVISSVAVGSVVQDRERSERSLYYSQQMNENKPDKRLVVWRAIVTRLVRSVIDAVIFLATDG